MNSLSNSAVFPETQPSQLFIRRLDHMLERLGSESEISKLRLNRGGGGDWSKARYKPLVNDSSVQLGGTLI